MPTEVVPGSFRRFLLDIEEEEVFNKYDVHILERSPEPWVEIYMSKGGEDEGEFIKEPVITGAVSEVVELLEKMLSYIKSAGMASMKDMEFDEAEIL